MNLLFSLWIFEILEENDLLWTIPVGVLLITGICILIAIHL